MILQNLGSTCTSPQPQRPDEGGPRDSGTPVLTPTRCQHGDGSAEHSVISGAVQQIVLQHRWWPSGAGQSPPVPAGGASGGQPEPEELSFQVGNKKLQRNLAGVYEHS